MYHCNCRLRSLLFENILLLPKQARKYNYYENNTYEVSKLSTIRYTFPHKIIGKII